MTATKKDTCLIPFPRHYENINLWWQKVTWEQKNSNSLSSTWVNVTFDVTGIKDLFFKSIHFEKVWFSENCQGFWGSLKPPPLSSFVLSLCVREMLFKQHHSERSYFWMSLDGYYFPQVRHVAGGELTLALPGFIKVFAYVYGRRAWGVVRCVLLQHVKLAMIIVSKLAWGWNWKADEVLIQLK